MKKVAAFIPVRGGSKSIPLKNIRPINGRPLVYWVLDAAVQCSCIDEVYLCTDSDVIKSKIEDYIVENDCANKLLCIDRPVETATDIASSESVLLYFANAYSTISDIVFIQATSPLLKTTDLEAALAIYGNKQYDSILSVARQKRFCWAKTDDGYMPINYDYNNRPRRQEFDGYLVENGAFYINSRNNILRDECRLSGRIGIYEMSEESYFEIDEPSDWLIIEAFLSQQQKFNLLERAAKIKMLLTDCDGVLTDGGMYYSESGDELKKFNAKDGMAVQFLREHSVGFGIITGEDIGLVQRRALKLKADECYVGVKDKTAILVEICKKHNLSYDEIAYIGDDVNDVEILNKVGLACSVVDAVEAAKNAADYITKAAGGQGALREVTELIIASQQLSK